MNKELIYRLRVVADTYNRATHPILPSLLNDAADTLEKCSKHLEEIDKIADVMIGNGPGAIEAYRNPYRNSMRGATGLPTQFSHMVAHAKTIREIIEELK